jgi:hypothetical protein
VTREDHSEDDELQPRTSRAVAERCLALIAVVGRSLGTPREQTLQWLEKHELLSYLSDAERAYLLDEAPSQQTIVNFSWRAEALAALLWALEGITEFEPLNVQVDLGSVAMFRAAGHDPEAFLSAARLRPREILEEAESDLYHQHWRVRDAQLFGKPMPADLDPGIVYERRYALSWLVGWGADWDYVPTDT